MLFYLYIFKFFLIILFSLHYIIVTAFYFHYITVFASYLSVTYNPILILICSLLYDSLSRHQSRNLSFANTVTNIILS